MPFKKQTTIHAACLLCFVGLVVLFFYGDTTVFVISSPANQSMLLRLHAEAPSGDSLPQTKLIINTYMRSGSSFIGKIFSGRNDTFYVYEPLWRALNFRFYNGSSLVCHYSQPGCVGANTAEESETIPLHRSLDFLTATMNCSFTEDRYADFLVDVKNFRPEFPGVKHSWGFYKSWDEYKECASSGDNCFRHCLKAMQPVCLTANHRVAKVLRTSLDNLETLLKRVPSLKIIQSFRDPRGVINSRLHTPFYMSRIKGQELVENDIRVLCDRMTSDLETATRLERLYPGRIKIIQYEDLWDLTKSANVLYRFAGMSSAPDVTSFLSDIIEPNGTRAGFHPYNYQQSLSWPTIQMADTYCSRVIEALGYPMYLNETTYRNSSDSVHNIRLTYTLL